MDSSTSNTAPASSPPTSTHFPEKGMVGRGVELSLPYRECVIFDLKREETQERTLVTIQAPGALFPEGTHQFETRGGIKFEGSIEMDGETTTHTQAMVLITEDSELKGEEEVTIVRIRVPGPVFQERIQHLETRGGIEFQGMVDMDGKTTTHKQAQATVVVTDASGTRGGIVYIDGETTTHRQAQATDTVLVTVESGLKVEEGQQLTVKILAPRAVFPEIIHQLKTGECIKFQGKVGMDGQTTTHRQAKVLVRDRSVSSCRCCNGMGVPTPPFSSSMEGMAVRFSESDPHKIEATIQTVKKQPTLSEVELELTSLPPYSACIGDIIVLKYGMNSWEATVIYFPDQNTPPALTILENKICIHVLDKHAPQGPKCLPHSTILVRPAQGPPSSVSVTVRPMGKESQRKRKQKERGGKQKEIGANNKKIKVGIDGYKDTGRALARVALDSEDVDLVAINDPSITDQSCMFRDSRCDFEVKSSSYLSLGKKEVNFFQESDPSAVSWYIAGTELVVTSRDSSQAEENYHKEYASSHSQFTDHKIIDPLEIILGASTIPRNSWVPILKIRPISSTDAKAVSDWFPLWKGKPIASMVHFRGVDAIVELGEYPNYESLPSSTKPSIDVSQLLRWCFHILSQIPRAVCDVEISQRRRRG